MCNVFTLRDQTPALYTLVWYLCVPEWSIWSMLIILRKRNFRHSFITFIDFKMCLDLIIEFMIQSTEKNVVPDYLPEIAEWPDRHWYVCLTIWTSKTFLLQQASKREGFKWVCSNVSFTDWWCESKEDELIAWNYYHLPILWLTKISNCIIMGNHLAIS